MDLSPLFDPLFRVPFMVGLLASLVLPVIGVLLRLRDEWLAALGLAHLAAATGLLGLAFHLPVVAGAPIGALFGAAAKAFLGTRGNTAYALMILVGWSATLLVAANTALGDALSHAIVDGQLYFAQTQHLLALVLFTLLAMVLLPWLSPRLLRAKFFPFHDSANRLPAYRWHLTFDILVALGMALGTATIGLMAAFGLVFIPPWLAFHIAPCWRGTLLLSTLFGLLAYLVSFFAAIALDQPFGPVMVTVLLLEVPVFYFVRNRVTQK